MSAKRIILKEWVEQVGVNEVAALLRVDRSAVRHWVNGRVLPMSWQMFHILELSKHRVDFNETILWHYSSANKKRIR